MLQRIQTVFLLFVIVFAIIIFFFPLATFMSEVSYLKLFICTVRDLSQDPFNEMAVSGKQFPVWYMLPATLLQLGCMVLAIITILKFRKRTLQIRLNYLNIFLHVLLVGAIFYYAGLIEKATGTVAQYGMGIAFPLVSIVLLFLANNFINKDEKLIRSADRLR